MIVLNHGVRMQEMSYDHITEACLKAFDAEDITPLELLETLMDRPGVPMHDPIHHYIMPATLLCLAARSAGKSREELAKNLAEAEERARKLLPGFCGWWGACGSAVGCGVFASVWMGVSPKKEANWAQINAFTAKCLQNVASVNGPRCCKRTSYLALQAAIQAAKELFGLNLGEAPEPSCTWSHFNRECKKDACPFYAERKPASEHAHLRQGIDALH